MAVLVFVDGSNGKLKKAAYEAVFYGSKLAADAGTDTVAVALGTYDSAELEKLGKAGANKVLHANSDLLNTFDAAAYTKVLAQAVQQVNANTVVVSYNLHGQSVAPRLSARLKAGLVPGVIDFPTNDGGKTLFRKSVYSGKAFADYEVLSDKKIIGLNPNSVQVQEKDGKAQVEQLNADVSSSDFAIKVKEVKKSSTGVVLTEAEIVVSAGRGLKGPENWGMIEDLASTINAATACSRPVADIGWRPHHEHVGQTGHTVRPNLYIAVGISGAIQHLAGVNGSKVIVVINKDPEAPFFKAADYGVIGDAFEVVPKLTEAFRKFKENHN